VEVVVTCILLYYLEVQDSFLKAFRVFLFFIFYFFFFVFVLGSSRETPKLTAAAKITIIFVIRTKLYSIHCSSMEVHETSADRSYGNKYLVLKFMLVIFRILIRNGCV